MKVVYSTANLAWIVLWKGVLQDINGRRFWSDKKDLVYNLKLCGLKIVDGNKIVSSDGK